MITAIDPGPVKSAYCVLDAAGVPFDFDHVPNDTLLARLPHLPGDLVVEMIACYGMAVGAEVFETCVWIGRIIQSTHRPVARLKRLECKVALCRNARANDANVRQALIDRFGGKDAAIGKKATPGPCYGMAGDCWAALAVACTYHDKLNNREG